MPNPTPRIRKEIPSIPPSSDRGKRAALRRGLLLIYGQYEIPFSEGEFVIGRDDSCDILIGSGLVSRRHAVLHVTDNGSFIEDLGSANGVFVNGQRVQKKEELRDGDEVTVATDRMTVVDLERAMPSQRRVSLSSYPARQPHSESPRTLTERVDLLTIVGKLADDLLEAGEFAKAERTLFEHLKKIMYSAGAGQHVPDGVREKAAEYALKLACATGKGEWVDYAVGLHLRSEQVMSNDMIEGLQEAREDVERTDLELFGFYLEALRKRADELTDDEQTRLIALSMLGSKQGS